MNMTAESVFLFKTYKSYLSALCGAKGTRKGMRSAIARASECNSAYISQVLNGDRHFSLEQAQRLSEFLHHNSDESHFFLLLIQRERSGTRNLRRYFDDQLKALLDKRTNVRERLGKTHQITTADQSKYYSSWLYAAVHIAVSVPEFQNRESLARRLGVPTPKIAEVLDFLFRVGLLTETHAKLSGGPAHIHLGNDSDLIVRHHSNWRMQAMKAIDGLDKRNLHYSAAVSLSRDDFERIKDKLIEVIQEVTSTISQSHEENLCAFNLDWFIL